MKIYNLIFLLYSFLRIRDVKGWIKNLGWQAFLIFMFESTGLLEVFGFRFALFILLVIIFIDMQLPYAFQFLSFIFPDREISEGKISEGEWYATDDMPFIYMREEKIKEMRDYQESLWNMMEEREKAGYDRNGEKIRIEGENKYEK